MELETTKDWQRFRGGIRAVFRRHQLLWLASSLFAIAVLQVAHFLPTQYTGVTRFQRESDFTEEMVARDKGEPFETIKQTLPYEIGRQETISQVVDELGLCSKFPHDASGKLTAQGEKARQELIGQIVAGLDVRWEVRSPKIDLIMVSFTHSDQNLAEKIPNALVKNYIDRTALRIIERLTATRDFLLQQTNIAKAAATELQKKRTGFVAKNAYMFPDNPGAIQDRILRIETTIDVLRGQLVLAKRLLQNVQAQRVTSSMELTPVEVIKGPNGERRLLERELQAAYDESREVFTDQHPKATDLREKILKLERRIAEMPDEAILQVKYATGFTGAEMVAEEIRYKTEVEFTERELERQQALLKTYEDVSAKMGPSLQTYKELTKESDLAESDVARWQSRLTDVELSLSAETAKRRTHLEAVEQAHKPALPSSPSLMYILTGALGGGLAFGFALVFLFNVSDRTITTSDDALRNFNLPIYGAIGEIVSPTQAIMQRSLRKGGTLILALAIVFVLALSVASVVLWLKYPEVYTQLKTAMGR